jgi:Mg/Co/Ni transporter MgtE
MAYRVGDYLVEHPLSAKKQKAIENMTEAEALAEVLEAAESWDSEVNEYIFQELSKEEQKGYALQNAKHERAIEIVRGMLKERREST